MCNSELRNTDESTGLAVVMPTGSCEQYLCVAHSQRLFQFLPALLDLKEKTNGAVQQIQLFSGRKIHL